MGEGDEMSPLDTTTWLCGPPPAQGQRQRYPGRFEFNLIKNYPCVLTDHVLQMFAGSLAVTSKIRGVTTDARPETGADIVAPYDALPSDLRDFGVVIADPPYNMGYGSRWTGEQADATLPRPKRIAAEAMKVLRPGGLFFLLHIIILPAYKDLGMERVALHPILTGPNNAIRVLNVMRKIIPT